MTFLLPLLIFALEPCPTLMRQIQMARTFDAAIEVLQNSNEHLTEDQLKFWSKLFRQEFRSQGEFISYMAKLSVEGKR